MGKLMRCSRVCLFTHCRGTAYVVLEAYGVTDVCNLYPKAGAVNFTGNVAAFDGKVVAPLPWTFMTQTAGCGEHAAADPAGDDVQIIFNTA